MNIRFNNIDSVLRIRKLGPYGVSIAVMKGDEIVTYCSGSGRRDGALPVNPDMLFQAGSVSKPAFAATLLRFVDKGKIELDADISGIVPEFAKAPLTFPALLSHTAGFNVHGFDGYHAKHKLLSSEDVLMGRGNSPAVRQTMPYGEQAVYSGGGITLAELAFTRMTGITLREAFDKEVAQPLGLTRSGYFQPLDESLVSNAAFGGNLKKNDHYHYYPEHAAAGLWTTPTDLVKLGIALSRSIREGGFLSKESAQRMATPIMDNYGLCLSRWNSAIRGDEVAGHDGWNEGFLTCWTFSVKEDLCVAAMINRSTVWTDKKLTETEAKVFRQAKNEAK